MKRLAWALGIAVLAVASLVLLRGEQIYMSWRASSTEKVSLQDLQSTIVPALTIKAPDDTRTPRAVVVLMHGCGGLSIEHQSHYAQMVVDRGMLAVIIDSNGPRGFNRQESLQTICRGQALLGQERAGDILAALHYIQSERRIDLNNVILAGWSHGAWTAMDFLTMDIPNHLPTSLSAYDGDVPQVRGAILFYPHCGGGSRSHFADWHQSPETLVLLAENDSVVDNAVCRKVFDRLGGAGIDIAIEEYPGVDHAFDNAYLSSEVAHWYDQDAATQAYDRFAKFLDEFVPK